jgi:hypothetical protein
VFDRRRFRKDGEVFEKLTRDGVRLTRPADDGVCGIDGDRGGGVFGGELLGSRVSMIASSINGTKKRQNNARAKSTRQGDRTSQEIKILFVSYKLTSYFLTIRIFLE